MEEHHRSPDSPTVYHGYGRGVPRLCALCVDGLPEKNYIPTEVDDDIALAWLLQFHHEIACYSVDSGTGAIHHCTLGSLDAARDYFSSLYGHDLRTVWL